MSGIDIGDECDVGGSDFGKRSDFAGMIGADFGDDDFCIALGGKDCEGQADIVVETFG